MKAILSIAAMLTVGPLVAVTTLVCWQSERWAGSLNPMAIVVMALFGLLTVPLWPTYIPALVWAVAGAVSGAVTLTLICLLYRYEERPTESGRRED